jgi:hypothetical protein
MSLVNLHSFAVRNVLGLLRTYYGLLAVQSASSHPTLLPWKDAHPGLKGMLTDLGTRTHKISFGDRQVELPLPGFSRFFDDKNREGLEQRLGDQVFGPRSRFRTASVGIDVDEAGNPIPGPEVAIVIAADWIVRPEADRARRSCRSSRRPRNTRFISESLLPPRTTHGGAVRP